MKMKKLTTFALAAAFTIGTFGISVPVKAAENSTDYTITIPATLTVEQKGWNATDGIKAQVKSGDTFDTSKKLTVTAASTNSWALKSGKNSIGYNLATSSADYSASAAPASWEFSATDLNADGGKTNPMGIIVEDYSSKPAGTYQDTVTFTAKVEDAVTITYSSIGTALNYPSSMPANFTEVTLEEAQAYGQSLTGPWLIIYARSGSNYKFINSRGANKTRTWDDIIYGESYATGQSTSIIVPVKN